MKIFAPPSRSWCSSWCSSRETAKGGKENRAEGDVRRTRAHPWHARRPIFTRRARPTPTRSLVAELSSEVAARARADAAAWPPIRRSRMLAPAASRPVPVDRRGSEYRRAMDVPAAARGGVSRGRAVSAGRDRVLRHRGRRDRAARPLRVAPRRAELRRARRGGSSVAGRARHRLARGEPAPATQRAVPRLVRARGGAAAALDAPRHFAFASRRPRRDHDGDDDCARCSDGRGTSAPRRVPTAVLGENVGALPANPGPARVDASRKGAKRVGVATLRAASADASVRALLRDAAAINARSDATRAHTSATPTNSAPRSTTRTANSARWRTLRRRASATR